MLSLVLVAMNREDNMQEYQTEAERPGPPDKRPGPPDKRPGPPDKRNN